MRHALSHRSANGLSLAFAIMVMIALSLMISPVTYAQPTDEGDIVVLFDGSASMLAQVDGEAKIDTGRRVVETFLSSVGPDRRTGLVAFGHTRAGSCDDIETLVPLSTDRSAMRSALEKIRPRGMTPLSSALEKVAEDYRGNGRALMILLVSDGGDQCFRDPCEIAKKLADANASVTANVIGLGPGAEHDLPQLKCIAEATGGRYVSLDEFDEFSAQPPRLPPEIGLQDGRGQNGGEQSDTPIPVPVPTPTELDEPETPRQTDVPDRRRPDPVPVEPEPRPIPQEPTPREPKPEDPKPEDPKPTPEPAPNPGRPAPEPLPAQPERAQDRGPPPREIVLPEDEEKPTPPKKDDTPTRSIIDIVRLPPEIAIQRPPAEEPAKKPTQEPAKPSEMATERAPERVLERVPEPVDRTPVKVTLRAIGADKKPLDKSVRVTWDVTAWRADGAPGKRVAFKAGSVITFEAPPARYNVKASQGEDAEQNFVIDLRRREQLVRDVVFSNGTISLTAHLAKGTPALKTPVLGWTLTKPSEGGKNVRVAGEAGASVSFVVPAGQYEGVVRGEDISVSFRTSVNSNTKRAQRVILNAGVINAAGPKGASWTLSRVEKDRKPVRAASEVADRTRFLVPAGNYVIQLRVGENVSTERVTVRAGQTVPVTMSVQARPRIERPVLIQPQRQKEVVQPKRQKD